MYFGDVYYMKVPEKSRPPKHRRISLPCHKYAFQTRSIPRIRHSISLNQSVWDKQCSQTNHIKTKKWKCAALGIGQCNDLWTGKLCHSWCCYQDHILTILSLGSTSLHLLLQALPNQLSDSGPRGSHWPTALTLNRFQGFSTAFQWYIHKCPLYAALKNCAAIRWVPSKKRIANMPQWWLKWVMIQLTL